MESIFGCYLTNAIWFWEEDLDDEFCYMNDWFVSNVGYSSRSDLTEGCLCYWGSSILTTIIATFPLQNYSV